MVDNKYKGKTLDFWQLLQGQRIEIPIIQRDYAQGREDKREIRDNFLNALYDSLITGTAIKLDFIYGSKEDGAFQPLDGQQRLTTLYLLHWYAYKKDANGDNSILERLKKFSYETRISSREFCKAIVENQINIREEIKLSDQIIDSSWFFLSWKKDPTIDAMLRMIDDIHTKFFNIDNLSNKLSGDHGLISFYHVELEDIGLTDDLYIKMNARGKLLSPYENFKASFQKTINDNNWEVSMPFIESFACKVDTIWTDLFWQHRKENIIDEAFMRFISGVAMIRQSIERFEERLATIQKYQENPNSVKPDSFTERGFKYLCDCFDLYARVFANKEDITLNFPLWQHQPNDGLFSALVYEDNLASNLQRNSASYTQKVLFYAQTEYLLRSSFKRESFLDWMRVIRNIVSRGDIAKSGERNTIIRSPQAFDGVVNLINELADGCEDIYKFLSEKDSLKSAFAREQIEEEKMKAKIIVSNSLFKTTIFAVEDTNLLQGRIDFALFCIDYNKKPSDFDNGALQKIQQAIKTNFDGSEINDDLRRAMLTIEVNGSYKFYEYWWSFWNVVSAQKRCLFDKYRELEYYIYGNYKYRDEYKIYFKKLLLKLIDTDLKKISESFQAPAEMPNWKVRLIKEPNLLSNKCKSHYIAIPEDESCCYLLKSLRPRDLEGCEKII